MRAYLRAFLLTWLTESAVVFPFLRRAGWKRILFSELLLNLATHPLLWFGLLHVPGPYLRNLFAAESLVATVEAVLALPLYRGFGFRRARIMGAVVAANAVTFLMTFVF